MIETLLDGARVAVAVPDGFNGTLLLWNRTPLHLSTPGEPVELAAHPVLAESLLADGYALAATNYTEPPGGAFAEALTDTERLLSHLHDTIAPERVVAWGGSGGGLLATHLAERGLVDGAMPLGGAFDGPAGILDRALGYAQILTTRLASDIPVTGITDPLATLGAVRGLIGDATPQALAEASAAAEVPSWFEALKPRPAEPADVHAALVKYGTVGIATFWATLRGDVEKRLGGNPSSTPSWVAGVPPIEADPGARAELEKMTPTGAALAPVLALHSTGDGLTPVGGLARYLSRADRQLVRAVYASRGGHVCFTFAEIRTTLRALFQRLDTGAWPDLTPARMLLEAAAEDAALQRAPDWGATWRPVPASPAFI